MLAKHGTFVSPAYTPPPDPTGSTGPGRPLPVRPDMCRPAVRSPRSRAGAVADLRAEIDRIERQSLDVCADDRVVGLGEREIDAALPWGGLPRGVLHEVVAGDVGVGHGFVAAILGRLAAAKGCRDKKILWCLPPAGLYETGNLYAPALAAYGLDPGRLLVARGRRDADIQWAMEEGLRCSALSAVVGQVRSLDLTTSRCLQLAARRSGVTVFLLMSRGEQARSRQEWSAAVTRWRITSAPADVPAAGSLHGTAWQLELVRCRGGLPRQWRVGFDTSGTQDRAGKGVAHVPGRFRVATAVCDRSPVSGRTPAADSVAGETELAVSA